MHRRNILHAVLSSLAATLTAIATSSARAAVIEPVPAPRKLKVVYHLSDLDKVAFVLDNIENHIAGVGGRENVTLALVVHGPALRAFHASAANPDMTRRVGRLTTSGVAMAACGNTMTSQHITLRDLLPGFVNAEKGGVVRIAELQSMGYLYLRP